MIVEENEVAVCYAEPEIEQPYYEGIYPEGIEQRNKPGPGSFSVL
jgi:hypothetical protein